MFRLYVIFMLFSSSLEGQTLGGETVFNFINLSNSPQLTALGGINLTNKSNDVGMVFHNPALLKSSMNGQLNMVFNSFYAGIKNYFVQSAYDLKQYKTVVGMGIHYFNYGDIQQTDASGNIGGTIRPSDYLVQLTAARLYGEKFHYGVALKFIHSSYGIYRSSGIAMDASVLYTDTTTFLQASLLLKNMGVQYRPFEGTSAGDLPFDIQAGISKKLAKAPLQFSLTLHHLHHFDILYKDTAYNNENGLTENKSFFFDKLFRHVVLSTQLFIGDHVEVSAGYNHLRRKELGIDNGANGLNGFSMGFGVLFRLIQIRYARAYYQHNRAYNQFGVNLELK